MNKIEKIEIHWFNDIRTEEDVPDITFFFKGSDNPFSSREFLKGSKTQRILAKIEELVYELNDV